MDNNLIIGIVRDLENIFERKTRYGICFVCKNIEYIQKIIDYLVNEHPEDVYDLSYYRDKHYTSEFAESEFRYLRFRSINKYEYTPKEVREDLNYWTQRCDKGHTLFIVIPKKPKEYFNFKDSELDQFNKKFYTVKIDKS